MFINFESKTSYSFNTFRKPGFTATTITDVWQASVNDKEEALVADIEGEFNFSEDEINETLEMLERGDLTIDDVLAHFVCGY